MRNGALITGNITCSSRPVDIRGCQFVPGAGFKYGENVSVWPPTQLNPASSAGQPKIVLLMVLSCPLLIFNCEGRRIGSIPMSMNGATVTGPTTVIRYSTFPNKFKSPPGCTIESIGTGIV